MKKYCTERQYQIQIKFYQDQKVPSVHSTVCQPLSQWSSQPEASTPGLVFVKVLISLKQKAS